MDEWYDILLDECYNPELSLDVWWCILFQKHTVEIHIDIGRLDESILVNHFAYLTMDVILVCLIAYFGTSGEYYRLMLFIYNYWQWWMNEWYIFMNERYVINLNMTDCDIISYTWQIDIHDSWVFLQCVYHLLYDCMEDYYGLYLYIWFSNILYLVD